MGRVVKRVREGVHFHGTGSSSWTGKTAIAGSMCRGGQLIYEVKCAAGAMLPLRDYRFGRDGVILLHEIEVSFVAAQRKLVQVGTVVVQLGTSLTHIHVTTCLFIGRALFARATSGRPRLRSCLQTIRFGLKPTVYVYFGEHMVESAE